MNDFSELEAELKALRPVDASPELVAKVEQALREPVGGTATAGVLPRRPKLAVNWFALGFGVAAAAAFLLLARAKIDRPAASKQPLVTKTERAVPAPVTQNLVSDGVTRVVYNTRDEGLIFPENSTEPLRRVRSHSRETLHWKDAGTGASLRVSYPTEEVEFVPVSFSSQ